MMKFCKTCAQEKPISDFTVSARHSGGRYFRCKECKNTKDRSYYCPTKERQRKQTRYYKNLNDQRVYGKKHRRKWFLSKINMTEFDIEIVKQKQNNVCAICNQPEARRDSRTGTLRELCADHCHNTNVFRGLLCSQCNLGVGHFKDSVELLRSAVIYLENHAKSKLFKAS